MATRISELIVSLVDRVSAPARQVSDSLRGIAGAVGGFNGKSMQGLTAGLDAAIARNSRQLDAMRGRMVDATAVGFALYRALQAPLAAAQNFETALLDIAQKAELSDDAMKALGDQIRAMAGQFNTSASSFARGVDFLLGMGLDNDRALAIMPDISKTAVAYQAQIEDLAKAGYAALDNLKVPASEFSRALDAMAQSGKMGAFELGDMAQYLPALASQAQNLGIVGVKGVADLAAALQVVRKGAGDSAEAATNLRNVMQKIESPATRKAFSKFGVNMQRELANAAKTGKSPLEALVEATQKAMKKGAKVSDLFQDQQVQLGLLALMQNLEEYRKIREEALKANGVVEEDYQRRIKTSAAQTALFQARMENLAITIGTALLPAMNGLLDKLGPLVKRFADFADANPALIKNLTLATSGLVAFRVAAIAARWAGLFALGGLLRIAKGALVAAAGIGTVAKALLIGPAIRAATAALAGLRSALIAVTVAGGLAGRGATIGMIGRSLLGLLNPIRLVTIALAGLKMAIRGLLIGTGIGAVIVGVGLAAKWAMNNVDNLKKAFAAFSDEFTKGIEPLRKDDMFGLVVRSIGDVITAMRGLTTEGDPAAFAAAGASAGRTVAGAFVSVANAIRDVVGLFTTIGDKLEAFRQWDLDLTSKIVDGAKAGWSDFERWWDNTSAGIREAVANLPSMLYDAGVNAVSSMIDGLKSKAADFATWMTSIDLTAAAKRFGELPGQIVAALADLPGQMTAAGSEAITGLIDGMTSKFAELISWVRGIPGRLAEAIGNIDLSSIIKWPTWPSWLGGEPEPALATPGPSASPRTSSAPPRSTIEPIFRPRPSRPTSDGPHSEAPAPRVGMQSEAAAEAVRAATPAEVTVTVQPKVDETSMDAAKAKAEQTGTEMQSSLSIRATPVVDTSSIDAATAKVRALAAEIGRVNSLSSEAVRFSQANYRRTMEGLHADIQIGRR
ncbi:MULTISPECIES: phage tail tape measure protein [unclassified Chelatococcus]|uniref:phage tail tape measure protein n=1 Tax=unclassified Chelatococcus TaxID=2638111 RepID=UPI001BCA8E8B|nr:MULTISPECIES: phage tail tape measure protein [unclassified Chelatococcus]CAH1672416.1 membrane hypothetical protein [Hyphomicrobiales bacterium]MBS7738953.1 phage tail tape measure protein [Chelatococcus sp. HY11]MBX3543386.1 phage tail tape measure protein [Chelatococcus sp.]MCO5076518.1 phage tail tape measure protein [Chelatococcus sp.]CAH1675352.1 membrane hypothetical protein [Hyphomicrobiales bacterium]